MGCRVNLPDKEGCTPLHWAAIRGNAEACTVLLQVGGPGGRGAGFAGWAAGVLGRPPCGLGYLSQAGAGSADPAAFFNPGLSASQPFDRLVAAARMKCIMPWKCLCSVQGGADEVLQTPDATGATPSQLAIEKGHRLLGLNLADYKYKQARGALCCAVLCCAMLCCAVLCCLPLHCLSMRWRRHELKLLPMPC